MKFIQISLFRLTPDQFVLFVSSITLSLCPNSSNFLIQTVFIYENDAEEEEDEAEPALHLLLIIDGRSSASLRFRFGPKLLSLY